MALIYPPVIDEEINKSAAESKVFYKIAQGLPVGWACIHSQWIRDSKKKIISEIDFVVITDTAILCLEVKGGKVRRSAEGLWQFISNNDVLKNEKVEGPFQQAKNACFDLKSHLTDVGFSSVFQDHAWTWGVVTPDCQMNMPDYETESSPDQYCGLVQFERNFEQFLIDLSSYAQIRKKQVTGREGHLISDSQKKRILSVVKPAIGYVETLGTEIVKAEENIKRLTEEQYHIWQLLNRESRIVLNGGAGTGKTVLAFEQARLKAESGNKVLFTCFNRYLADELAKRADRIPEMASVTIINFHRLLYSICKQAGLEKDWHDWQDINQNLHELFVEAVMLIDDYDIYDYLIIDEAQDLMREDFLNVLSDLLTGGIKNGQWVICLDEEQAIFERQYDKTTHKHIIASGMQVSLTQNLRNTKEVASWTYGLSRVSSVPASRSSGTAPLLMYYTSANDDLEKKLVKYINNQLKALDDSQFPSSSLVVLLARKEPYLEVLKRASLMTLRRMVEFGNETGTSTCFQWSTVQSFKGLEASSVILLGTESLENQYDRRQIYVGGSRARSMLTIFLQDDQADSVQNSLGNIMQYLS